MYLQQEFHANRIMTIFKKKFSLRNYYFLLFLSPSRRLYYKFFNEFACVLWHKICLHTIISILHTCIINTRSYRLKKNYNKLYAY